MKELGAGSTWWSFKKQSKKGKGIREQGVSSER